MEGKRVILVDDSIVRGGTTMKRIVGMLKRAGGAKEVHVRIAAPPVKYPCNLGMHTPKGESNSRRKKTVDEIKDVIGLIPYAIYL